MIKYLEQENDFINYINQELILVDFYADWCGPCKMLGTILEQVDFIEVLKINVDNFSDLAQKYGVMSIPTICIFSKGELKKKEIGFKPLNELEKIVEDIKKEIE
jgi:thioredoxin 1